MVDEKNLKTIIENILSEMADGNVDLSNDVQSAIAVKVTETVAQNDVEDGCIPDITEVDIKKQFLVPHAEDPEGYQKMKQFTPARLGLWRAGTRYKTQSTLRFRADHAAAQ
ncbi:MAG: ethanolamine ammonia-lyase light chain EutC, partial [Carnobacterium sp.]